MITSIMVPLDGSPFADRAIEPAAALASQHDARLHFVSVHEHLAPTEDAYRADREDLVEHLEQCRSAAAERWRITAVAHALEPEGAVGDTLAAFAERNGVDLVVMTTHGRGAAGRAWFGSVADRFIRIVPAPVLLIRQETRESRTAFRRILVPLDGSDAAERAIGDAVAVSHPDTEFFVLRVVVPVITFAPHPTGRTIALTGGVLDEQREEAAAYADGVVKKLKADGREAQGTVVVDTSPAAAILDSQAETQPDLIVMAGISRSGPDRFLLGSVMDKVVRHAGVPVLIRRTHTGGTAAAGS